MDDQFDGKQVELAEAIGIPANLISRYLSGTKGIGDEMRDKIEEACKCSGYLDARDVTHDQSAKDADVLLSSDGKYPLPAVQPQSAQEARLLWPFKHVDQTRYEGLSETGKVAVQFAMAAAIDRAEADGLIDTSRSKRSA